MNVDINLVNKSGIYLITNIINNKQYIGSSKNIYYRLHGHKSTLLKNTHRNIHLQRSFNKYGINNFKFEIIELCPEDELAFREQFYINTYDPEFNIIRLVERNIPSKESRIKISNTLKKKYSEGMPNGANKAIDVYNLKGEFIKSYISCIECAKDLKISQHSISNVLSGKYQQNCGYIFVEKGVIPNVYKKNKKKGIPVYLIDDKGVVEHFVSFQEAATRLNLNISTFINYYKKTGTYKNFKITKDVPV